MQNGIAHIVPSVMLNQALIPFCAIFNGARDSAQLPFLMPIPAQYFRNCAKLGLLEFLLFALNIDHFTMFVERYIYVKLCFLKQ